MSMQLISFEKMLSYTYDKKRKILHIFCKNIAQSLRVGIGENDTHGLQNVDLSNMWDWLHT